MTKNQTIELLKKQLPGYYSPEQVISLIEGIKEESPVSEGMLQALVVQVKTCVRDILGDLDSDTIVDMKSATFELLNGNEIVLDSVDIDVDTTIKTMENELSELIVEFFEQYDGITIE